MCPDKSLTLVRGWIAVRRGDVRWTTPKRRPYSVLVAETDPTRIQERWLAEIRRIVTAELAPYRADVILFGSRARGDHQVASDVDLAIDPQGPIPVWAISRLRTALEDSNVPLFVDVVDLRAADAALRERVAKEGRRWIASKSA